MDILNIMACFCVVFIHHSNTLVARYSDTPLWRESLVVECGMYWAVPVFVMISGANLLNYRKKYTTAEFLKKKIFKDGCSVSYMECCVSGVEGTDRADGVRLP